MDEDDYITVSALVPGFAPEQLSISVQRDVLSLSGHCPKHVPDGFSAKHVGRLSADFAQSVKLMTDVVQAETRARLEEGVLTIRLRKYTPALRTPIPVRLP